MNNKAIPTEYKGVRMRSRLEAKWAFMFDALGWKWEYEPIDCDGWIPDFVLIGASQNVLVEVKPIFTFEEAQPAIAKIDRAYPPVEGNMEVLLLGAALFPTRYWLDVQGIGWLREEDAAGWATGESRGWGEALLWDNTNTYRRRDTCTFPPGYDVRYGFSHDSGSYHERLSGAYNDGQPLLAQAGAVDSLWTAATNNSQWRKAA